MTISDILNTARDLAGQPQEWTFTDALLLRYLNIEYHENADIIATHIKWGRYFTTLEFDLVEWTNLYLLPETSSSVQWLKEIHRVEILVNGQWKILKERKLTNLQYNPLEYNDSYFVKWSSIELIGTWHKSETDWLKVHGTTDIANLTLWTAEWDIDIPYDWWYVLAMWVVPYIHAIERRYDEEANARQRYKSKLREKIATAKMKRYQTIYKDNPPSDDVYRE